MSDLATHLSSGVTTLCTAWAITRKDGVVLGFTDHDSAIEFDGITFRADSGLSAKAMMQSTGLSVDNTEALGALRDDVISERDIDAGRYDGADIRTWLVNWAQPDQNALRFRGTIGEIRRGDGVFNAEIRGLADYLNQPSGRVFHKPCSAVLGDGACGLDLTSSALSVSAHLTSVSDARTFTFPNSGPFAEGWFERGRLKVLSGPAQELTGMIKRDQIIGSERRIDLWSPIAGVVSAGDQIRLEAGCDKRMQTCRDKFDNMVNFRGFPDIPGEDWRIAAPSTVKSKNGGSRR